MTLAQFTRTRDGGDMHIIAGRLSDSDAAINLARRITGKTGIFVSCELFLSEWPEDRMYVRESDAWEIWGLRTPCMIAAPAPEIKVTPYSQATHMRCRNKRTGEHIEFMLLPDM